MVGKGQGELVIEAIKSAISSCNLKRGIVPSLDQCHTQVVHALQTTGWLVSPNSHRCRVARRIAFIDISAVQANRKIYVEVKCFSDPKDTDEQYRALGQYVTYQTMLRLQKDMTPLYLAIPSRMDNQLETVFGAVLGDLHIKFLIFDELQEIILRWNE